MDPSGHPFLHLASLGHPTMATEMARATAMEAPLPDSPEGEHSLLFPLISVMQQHICRLVQIVSLLLSWTFS